MEIRRATSDDLGTVHHLIQDARQLYKDYGREDLGGLLAEGQATIAEEDGRAVGFLGIQVEARPTTLPIDAPTRAALRCVALSRYSDLRQMFPLLLKSTQQRIVDVQYPLQITSYGHEEWYVRALRRANFAIVDRMRFFQLDRLAARSQSMSVAKPVATLTAAHVDHIIPLAELDAKAFPPLWHFGEKDMVELLMRCDVLVALLGEKVVGYAAITTNSRTEAQLARLAVHPDYQGNGIGRQLLDFSIRHAVECGFAVMILNTQTENNRSQNLYRSFGFRPIGSSIPVFAKMICK